MPRRVNDPYNNFRFVVELGSVQVAGFAECAGLQYNVPQKLDHRIS